MKRPRAGRSLPGPRRFGLVAGRCGPDAMRRKSSDHNSAPGYPGKELKKRIIGQNQRESVKSEERKEGEKGPPLLALSSSHLVHSSKQASCLWRSPRGLGVSETSGKGRHSDPCCCRLLPSNRLVLETQKLILFRNLRLTTSSSQGSVLPSVKVDVMGWME